MATLAMSRDGQTPRSRTCGSQPQSELAEQEQLEGKLTNLLDNVIAQEKFLKEIKSKKSWWTLVIHLRDLESTGTDGSEDVTTLYGDIGYLQMHCEYIRNAVKWEENKRDSGDTGSMKGSTFNANIYHISIPAEQFTEYELAYLIGHLYRPDLFGINIEMAPRLAELADFLGAECVVRTCRSTLEDAIHKTIRKFKEPCASCQRRIRRMEDLSLLTGRPSQRTLSIASTRRPISSQSSLSNFIGCSCIESSLNEMSSKQKGNLEFLSSQLVTSITHNLYELQDILIAFFLERRPRIEFLVATKAFGEIPDSFKVDLLLRAFKSNMF